jgi:hypothetical protein
MNIVSGYGCNVFGKDCYVWFVDTADFEAVPFLRCSDLALPQRPEFNPEQSMWNLWENTWNWDRFLFECFGFTL